MLPNVISRSKYLLTGIFLTTITMAVAQHQRYTPVSDLIAFKKNFAVQSAKVQTIVSQFTQEKTLTALTEKIASSGNFWFKRSNKVRLEYLQPFVYRMIMNGDRLTVKDHQKENTVNIKSSKLFQQVNRIVIDCVQGTILDSKDFNTRVFENTATVLLEMTPVSKNLLSFFETIVLKVDKADYSAVSITMNEPGGDVTQIVFIHKKINEVVSDSVFNP